jgi:hypothetical protein
MLICLQCSSGGGVFSEFNLCLDCIQKDVERNNDEDSDDEDSRVKNEVKKKKKPHVALTHPLLQVRTVAPMIEGIRRKNNSYEVWNAIKDLPVGYLPGDTVDERADEHSVEGAEGLDVQSPGAEDTPPPAIGTLEAQYAKCTVCQAKVEKPCWFCVDCEPTSALLLSSFV